MFEVSQIIVQSVLRQWGTLGADDRDGVYKYLMHLAVSHAGYVGHLDCFDHMHAHPCRSETMLLSGCQTSWLLNSCEVQQL